MQVRLFLITILILSGFLFCRKETTKKIEPAFIKTTDTIQTQSGIDTTTIADGNRTGDSLALVALKNSGYFTMWPRQGERRWDSTAPLEKWAGIHIHNNRVDSIHFVHAGCKQLSPEISAFSALTYLNIADNDIDTLPAEIGNLTNLRVLNCAHQFIGNDKLKTLPAEIGNLTNLEILCCNSNVLLSLPSEIGKCTHLKKLLIDRNGLTELPPGIGNCKELTQLMAWANQLTAIPPEIGNCTALEYLNIGANKITTLPNEISKLTRLKSLILSNNDAAISEVPKVVFSLKTLTFLSLSNNSITLIPPEIKECSNLDSLFLNDNKLTSLPDEITSLTNLTAFSISNNNIEDANLSAGVIAFLDKYDPEWRQSQNIEQSTERAISNPLDTTGAMDQLAIIPPDSESYLYNMGGAVPQAGSCLVLCGKKIESWVEPASISVVKDSIDDFYNGRMEGWVVRTEWKKELLMYLRGIPGLKEGPVKTWYINDRWSRKKPFPDYSFPLQKKQFAMSFSLLDIGVFAMRADIIPACDPECGTIESIQWLVKFGQAEWWRLPVVPANTSDPMWAVASDAILWIGDLDSDGKPDMIMSPILGPVERYRYYQLFLSTTQNSGHIWKSSAKFFHYPPTTGD